MKTLMLISLITLLSSITSMSARSDVGDELPSAQVTELDGQSKDLKELIGDAPTVLIFYRGGWCPYCNKHLSDLNTVKDELKSLGFKIIALSTDQPSEIIKSLDETDLDYTLISDAKMNASDALGISYVMSDEMLKKYVTYGIDLEKASGETHHKLPHPSVYLIKNGIIQFAYINEDITIRLSGAEILSVAKKL